MLHYPIADQVDEMSLVVVVAAEKERTEVHHRKAP